MYYSSEQISKIADRVVSQCGSRDPELIIKRLGINVIPCDFRVQKGAYKVILRERFIFINNRLSPVMKRIVLLHELGHDSLHRAEAQKGTAFQEFDLFSMQNNRMEYEANIFAADVSLPDSEILDYISEGASSGEIAALMGSDINLVALKVTQLKKRGYDIRELEYRSDYLN